MSSNSNLSSEMKLPIRTRIKDFGDQTLNSNLNLNKNNNSEMKLRFWKLRLYLTEKRTARMDFRL